MHHRVFAVVGPRQALFGALLSSLVGFASCGKDASAPESAERVEVESRSEELLPELSGLRVHLDAAGITGVADGAVVSSWSAVVGPAAGQFTQGGTTIAAPSYMASSTVMGGRPALRFGRSAASALQFSVPGSGGAPATSNQLTVVVVGSRYSDAQTAHLWSNDHVASGVSAALRLGDKAAGGAVLALQTDGAAAAVASTAGPVGDQVATIATLRLSASGQLEVFRDGIAGGSAARTAGQTPLAGVLGYYVDAEGTQPSSATNGLISEVLVYDRALDNTELAAVHAHLNDKYNIVPAVGASGLVHWLRADHCAGPFQCRNGACGVAAASCDNLAASGADATQTTKLNQPIAAHDMFAGRHALRFDGANDMMTLASAGAVDSDYTVIAVTTPASPPAGASTWFRADRCAADVSRCTDLSGNGRDAVPDDPNPARRAELVANRIGGQPALVFERTDARVHWTDTNAALVSEYTASFVAERWPDTTYTLLFSRRYPRPDGTLPALEIYLSPAGVFASQFSDYSTSVNAGNALWYSTQPTIPVVITVRVMAQRMELWVGGSLVASTAVASIIPMDMLGSISSAAFAEAVFYKRALSDAELDRLHGYFHERYSLPLARILPPVLGTASTWFRADACATDGSRCTDLSGNGRDAVPASADPNTRPQVVPNRANGQPALQFDRTDGYLNFDDPSATPRGEYTASFVAERFNDSIWHTFFWVDRYTLPDGTVPGIDGYMASTGIFFDQYVNYNAYPNRGGGGAWWYSTVTPVPTLMTIRIFAQRMELWINGVLAASNPSVTSVPLKLLGGLKAAALAEAIYFERALTDTELSDLHAYLRRRYSLGTGTLPPAPMLSPKAGELWSAPSAGTSNVFLGHRLATDTLVLQHGLRPSAGAAPSWTLEPSTAPAAGQAKIVTLRASPTQHELFIDCQSAAAPSANVAAATLAGTLSSSALPYQGSVAELLVFDHALTVGELETVHSYLGRRYGLSTTQCAQVFCGDGVVSGSEACDTLGTAFCWSDCSIATAEPILCDPAAPISTCGPGSVCGVRNGEALGMPAEQSFCWPAICGSTSLDCGEGRPCGRCVCENDCSALACGGVVADPTCWNSCSGTCLPGQSGCTADSDCTADYACMAGTCRPARCLDDATHATECGSPSAACGPCILAEIGTKCSVQTCGMDEYGTSCGTCAEGSVCVAGTCQSTTNEPPEEATALAAVTTQAAGALTGQFNVDANGNATYSVQIALPPGRAGAQPALSLEYNSAAPRTAVGDGWSIGGLMEISRCNRSRVIDGYDASVTFTERDAFCLNGRRLHGVIRRPTPDIPIPEWVIGTEYRTDPDTFMRVFSRRVTPVSGPGYVEPEFFEAVDKDGTVYRFGKNVDARKWIDYSDPNEGRHSTLTWHLSEVEDTSGNIIRYNYVQNVVRPIEGAGRSFVQQVMVSEIEYPPYHRVRFEYERVPNARYTGQRWRAGVEDNVVSRLSLIRTFAGPTQARVYRVNASVENNAWRVHTISECTGTVPDVCLEPLVFTYKEPVPRSLVDTTIPAGEVPGGSDDDVSNAALFRMLPLDDNHDGRDDLFYTVFRDDYRQRKGFDRLRMVYRTRLDGGAYGPQQSSNLRADCIQHEILDFDHSGHSDDVFMVCLWQEQGVFIAQHLGNGQFQHVKVWDLFSGFSGIPETRAHTMLADLDGDTEKDLVLCRQISSNTPGTHTAIWEVRMKTGAVEYGPVQEIVRLPDTWCFPTRHFVLDMDGDGTEEVLMRRDPENIEAINASGGRKFFGKLTYRDGAPLFDPGGPVPPGEPRGGQPDPVLDFLGGSHLDINGDGLMDAVVAKDDGIAVVVNTGKTFAYAKRSEKPSWYSIANSDESFVADLNGDGRDEYYLPIRSQGAYARFLPLVDSETTEPVRDFRLTNIVYQYVEKGWHSPTRMNFSSEGYHSIILRGNERTAVTFDELPSNFRSTNRLAGVEAAGGHEVGIVYDILTDRQGSTHAAHLPGSSPACDSRQRCPRGTLFPIVSDVYEYAGDVGTRTTYEYERFRMDRYRRAPLGFAKITQIESGIVFTEIDQIDITTYDNTSFDADSNRFERAGLPQSTESSAVLKSPDGSYNISRLERTTRAWSKRRSDAGVFFDYLAGTEASVQENGVYTSVLLTVSAEPDQFGNSKDTAFYWDDGRYARYTKSYSPSLGIHSNTAEQASRGLNSLLRFEEVYVSNAGDERRIVTHIDYDGRGRPIKITRKDTDSTAITTDFWDLPDLSWTTRSYTAQGTLESEVRSGVSATTSTLTVDYDGTKTFPLAIHNALHDALGIAPARMWHDPATGSARWIRSPAGHTVTLNVDGFGRVREKITSGGTREETSYLREGLLESEYMAVRTAGTARPTHVAFLLAGDRISRTIESRVGSQDVVQQFKYDHLGRLASASVPQFSATGLPPTPLEAQIRYDALDRVIGTWVPATTPAGVATEAVTTYKYLPRALLAADAVQALDGVAPGFASVQIANDPAGASHYVLFDKQGNTVGSLDPGLTATRQDHDALGRVRHIAVGTGTTAAVTTLEHDSLGNVTRVEDPDTGIQTWQYDGLGYPRVAVRNGEETRFYWDTLGRLRLLTTIDGIETFTWDTDGTADPSFAGQLAESTRTALEGSSSYEYRYDGPDGAISSETSHVGSRTLTMSYSYDPGGQVGLVRWPNGTGARYIHDSSGRTTEVRDPDRPPTAPALWRATSWNQFDGVAERTYASGFGLHVDLDPRTGTVTRERTTALASGIDYAFGYDERGSLRTRAGSGYSETFVPDGAGRIDFYERRLGSAPTLQIDYGYDPIGNLESINALGTPGSTNIGTLSYDPANKPRAVRATSDGRGYDYDVHGNQSLRTGTGVPSGHQRISYNSLGLPVSVLDGDPAAPPTRSQRFVYGPDGRRLEKQIEDQQSTIYASDGFQQVEDLQTGSITTTVAVPFPDGTLLQRMTESGVTADVYLIVDPQGTVLAVVDGSEATTLSHSPFGMRLDENADDTPWGFVGGEEDPEVGVIHLGARLYDPAIGRFLSADPIVTDTTWGAQSLNAYSYAHNAPQQLSDPTGLDPSCQSDGCWLDGERYIVPAVLDEAGNVIGYEWKRDLLFAPDRWDASPFGSSAASIRGMDLRTDMGSFGPWLYANSGVATAGIASASGEGAVLGAGGRAIASGVGSGGYAGAVAAVIVLATTAVVAIPGVSNPSAKRPRNVVRIQNRFSNDIGKTMQVYGFVASWDIVRSLRGGTLMTRRVDKATRRKADAWQEKVKNANTAIFAGRPGLVVGHLPDIGFGGVPTDGPWVPIDTLVNSSIGGQWNRYRAGFEYQKVVVEPNANAAINFFGPGLMGAPYGSRSYPIRNF